MSRFPHPTEPDGTGGKPHQNTTAMSSCCQRGPETVDCTPEITDRAALFGMIHRRALFNALLIAKRHARELFYLSTGKMTTRLREDWTDPLSLLVDHVGSSWKMFALGDLKEHEFEAILFGMDSLSWPMDGGPEKARLWADRLFAEELLNGPEFPIGV